MRVSATLAVSASGVSPPASWTTSATVLSFLIS